MAEPMDKSKQAEEQSAKDRKKVPPTLHSVTLDVSLCKGCTTCIKRCPTEAIRVRGGKAVIMSQRCIDCGECIRRCPYNAKKAVFDKLSDFSDYKWKIALPAPALFGQIDKLENLDYVVSALLDCGFDDVFEVARAAELVSEYTREYLKREDIPKPVISSACPAVVRLISIRFPFLLDNVLPILAPVELAARIAKEEALQAHPELQPSDICVLFISPCPAKVSYVRSPLGVKESAVDGVLSISDIYFDLIDAMKHITTPRASCKFGIIGISWAGSGGESSALFNDKYLAADGIENVIQVLDEIEKENFAGLEFVELNACSGGCVGGAMNVENPFIAKARLQNLRRYLPVSQNHIPHTSRRDDGYVPAEVMFECDIPASTVMRLDEDRRVAQKKLAMIQELTKCFSNMDCGSCGAPTCAAFAEDIVRGEAHEGECVIMMRQTLQEILERGEVGESPFFPRMLQEQVRAADAAIDDTEKTKQGADAKTDADK